MAEPEKVPLDPEDTSTPPPPYASYGQPPYPQFPPPSYPVKEGVPGPGYPNQQGYYPQPWTGQAGALKAPPPGMVIVTQPSAVTVMPEGERPPSPLWPILFSCFVIWCCCWPIGLLAFIFAVCASSTRDVQKARQRLSAANALSIVGVVVGIMLLIFLFVYEWTVVPENDRY